MAAEEGRSQETGLRSARGFCHGLMAALALILLPAPGGPASFGGSTPAPSAERVSRYTEGPVAVRQVIDGDTIELADGERVRYLGVDSPELHRRVRGRWVESPEPYAREAREFNRRMVSGRTVRLELDREVRDRYHRLLAYVYVDQRMVNAELVASGHAVVRIHPPNLRYSALFMKLQSEARTACRGLWSSDEMC